MRLIFLLSLISIDCLSQGISFNKTYGNDQYEYGEDMVQLEDSSYVLVGSTSSFGSGNTDVLMIGIDKLGNFQWQRTFGNSGIEIAKNIIVKNENLFILGYTNNDIQSGYDIFLIKTDLDGTLEWFNTYGGSDWEFGHEMILDSQGNIVIAGETYSNTVGANDCYVIKINSENGEVIWERTYGGALADSFYDLCEDVDNNLWFVGFSDQTDTSLFILKADMEGTAMYTHVLEMEDTQIGRTITTDSNDNILFGFDHWKSNSIDSIEPTMVNISLDFDTIFIENITESDRIRKIGDIVVLKSGNIALVTNHTGNGFDAERWIYDSNGNFISTPGATSNFGDFGDEQFNSGISTLDYGLALFGTTDSWGSGYSNMWLVKQDEGFFAEDTPNEMYVTSIPELTLTQLSIYPNPAKDRIHVSPYSSIDYSYRIYHSNGYLVKLGVTSKNEIDISNLRSGTYILMLAYNEKLYGQTKFVKSDF